MHTRTWESFRLCNGNGHVSPDPATWLFFSCEKNSPRGKQLAPSSTFGVAGVYVQLLPLARQSPEYTMVPPVPTEAAQPPHLPHTPVRPVPRLVLLPQSLPHTPLLVPHTCTSVQRWHWEWSVGGDHWWLQAPSLPRLFFTFPSSAHVSPPLGTFPSACRLYSAFKKPRKCSRLKEVEKKSKKRAWSGCPKG